MRSVFDAPRQWSFRKSLKVEQTRVAPPDRVPLLYLQLLRHRRMPLRIDRTIELRPRGARRSHPIDAALIVQRHLIPQRPPRFHLVIPRDVMKPEQKLLRTTLDVRELFAHRQMILAHRVAAGLRAIEADAERVRFVIVNRVPVLAFLRVPPRRWSIVMPPPKPI